MEQHNCTDLVFLLDRSGSMSGLEEDTIGGYNALLAKQKETPGAARVTTVLFDDRYELLYDGVPLTQAEPLTPNQYFVRGTTALLDALGRTIRLVASRQRSLPEDLKADQVLFVITTDGLENSSREFRYDAVRRMVNLEHEEHGWEFLFLGANMDAIAAAGRFGIRPGRAVTYCPDRKGTRLNYETVNQAVGSMRECGSIPEDWKVPIEADYAQRGGHASR